ncbi:MAG: ATP-dependent protease, Lon family [Bacilli bacterium]|nr:ATP-dependent protease, Lon family [Bacilli bacterium]
MAKAMLSSAPNSALSDMERQVNVMYSLLSEILGPDKLVLRAGKVGALELIQSASIEERVLALQKIVFENASLDQAPALGDIPDALAEVQDIIADVLARRKAQERLETEVSLRLQEKQEEYLREVKTQILKENQGAENAQTLRKYAFYEKLETASLAGSTFELLRPKQLNEIVGQAEPLKSLLSKLASPHPQHILIYGPPGVGKTTAARIALAEAIRLGKSQFRQGAPFVEVNGTTLRWDPREITNPLLGSVHDPIYQGARRDLADSAIPEPKPGLVTDAHGGVLFIDEIGEMDPFLQNKLLKVLEDKRVYFDSPYYDPEDSQVPKYIKKLFDEGAPADFVLIGATTRHPNEINPALRSRCAEIFFEPLIPEQIEEIVWGAAKRLNVAVDPEVAATITQYTVEGRKAVGLLADAYCMALFRSPDDLSQMIESQDLDQVIRVSRLHPFFDRRELAQGMVGRIQGLGVSGFLGSVIELEAVVFPPVEAGKGQIRFNDTAGSMAKDSVFNAAAVFRHLTQKSLTDYDVHVNAVGGGQIDGPSAGVALFLLLYSSVFGLEIPQDLAVTGEISIHGRVKPVGGVYEKIFGARQAGLKRVLIPVDNKRDVPEDTGELEVILVETVEQALSVVFSKQHMNELQSSTA